MDFSFCVRTFGLFLIGQHRLVSMFFPHNINNIIKISTRVRLLYYNNIVNRCKL